MPDLSYAIGVAEPVSVYVQTFGTGVVPDFEIGEAIRKNIDLTPRGIIQRLNLQRPIYRKTAVYGHFGRSEKEFTWEKTDLVNALQKALR